MALTYSYFLRAWDSGTGGLVYWTSADKAATPAATDTNPNYTGTLSVTQVVFSIPMCVGGVATTEGGFGIQAYRPLYSIPTDLLVFSGSASRVA